MTLFYPQYAALTWKMMIHHKIITGFPLSNFFNCDDRLTHRPHPTALPAQSHFGFPSSEITRGKGGTMQCFNQNVGDGSKFETGTDVFE